MKQLLFCVGYSLVILLVSCSKNTDDDGGTSGAITITSFSPASGKEGCIVTITGKGFGDNKDNVLVKFGGTNANTIQSISNTQLVVELPIQAQTGKIDISTFTSSPASSKDDFTVISSFIQKNDFPGGLRNLASGFVIGSKAYMGLGSDGTTAKNDWWEYDGATGVWTKKADFPGLPRGAAAAFAIGAKGYIATGEGGGGLLKDLWEYNPATNAWTQKADLGGVARRGAWAFASATKGYLVSGLTGGAYSVNSKTYAKDVWEYDPGSNQWTKKNDKPGTAGEKGITLTINNKNYSGGGTYYDNTALQEKDLGGFYEYNDATDTWTAKANLSFAGYLNVGFSVNGKGYISTGYSTIAYGAGGGNLYFYTRQTLEYNPATNAWKKAPYLSGYPRSAAIGFAVNNKGYIVGGYGSPQGWSTGVGVLKDMWEFVPFQ